MMPTFAGLCSGHDEASIIANYYPLVQSYLQQQQQLNHDPQQQQRRQQQQQQLQDLQQQQDIKDQPEEAALLQAICMSF